MAIRLEDEYPGKVEPASDAYPQGAARNVTVSGDGTGTPLEAAWLNDNLGFQQAILARAGVDPSGVPDTAEESQYLDALLSLNGGGTTAAMIANASLSEGDWVETSGLLTAGDGGGDSHLIVSSASAGGHVLDNGLIAVPQTLADRQINHPERRLPRKLFKKLHESGTGISHLNIVCLGDSLGGQKMYMMASSLDRKFGGSNDSAFNSEATATGAGVLSGGNTLYPNTIVSGEAETGMYDYWFTGEVLRLDSGGSSLFIRGGVNPTCEVVEVYYVKESGSGSISLSIDSVVVATEDADDTIGMGKISWTKTLSQDEVKLSVTGGSVRVLFVQATTPSVSGVNLYDRFMTGGLTLSNPMGSIQCVDIVSSVLADIDPDLITFEFDDTGSDITVGFVTLKNILETETPYADKLLISSNPRSILSESKGNTDVYLRTQAAASNKSWLTFDAYNSVGSYEEMTAVFGSDDGVHPNVAAHAFWASAIWDRLGLNSDLMGFNTRAVLDASQPSRLGDGTSIGSKPAPATLKFEASSPFNYDWKLKTKRQLGFSDENDVERFRIVHNGANANIMPESWDFGVEGSGYTFSASTSPGFKIYSLNDASKAGSGSGNGAIVCLNKAPVLSRADLLGGDYKAPTLVGAVVRCTDGNAGDGLYIAVGANNTDWQLITTSGLV